MIGRLVSGGQTGVDRAALDVALELGIPCGGWCPRGRRAEDGTLPARYHLAETPSGRYSQRTRWNVRDSDATLLLCWGEPTGGTLLTLEVCWRRDKPHLVIDLGDERRFTDALEAACEWLVANLAGRTLNVAGPRETVCPGIYDRAREFLQDLLGRQRRERR
jgi:hypothetical protein